MEKYIVRKGVLSAALVLVTSFVCGFIAIVGFVLGDIRAVSSINQIIREIWIEY